MNVGYKELNCADVGRGLKLDKSTVAAWCRKGYINFTDVSEPGSKKARYQIPEWEYERIKKLIGKFGRREWLLHNAKDKERAYKEHISLDSEITIDQPEPTKEVPVKFPNPEACVDNMHFDWDHIEAEEKEKKKFDEDKLLNAIIYIREVRERIEDCKAELAQLENEYKALKEEIINQL